MIIIVIITLSFPCSRYRRRRREPCKPASTTILIIITTVTCVSRAKYRWRRDVRCVLRTRVIGRPGRARDWTVLLRDVCALYTLAAARTRRVPVDYCTDCSSCSAAEEKKKNRPRKPFFFPPDQLDAHTPPPGIVRSRTICTFWINVHNIYQDTNEYAKRKTTKKRKIKNKRNITAKKTPVGTSSLCYVVHSCGYRIFFFFLHIFPSIVSFNYEKNYQLTFIVNRQSSAIPRYYNSTTRMDKLLYLRCG